MISKKIKSIAVATAIFTNVFLGAFTAANAAPVQPVKTVKLSETGEAFKNPIKGFRPSRFSYQNEFKDSEYATIYKHYIKYTDLEKSSTDTVEKIKAWSNVNWAGIENKNIKVIPRVFIEYPNVGSYWPDGVPRGDWNSDALMNRMVGLTKKLGEAWDNDPRVAAVEVGLWGKWGEHNIWPAVIPGGNSRIPLKFQTALGNAFTAAFKNKKVMVRYPETFKDFNFGYLWDSFGVPEDVSCANQIIERNNWRTQMISGEVAYDWGDQSKLGKSPAGTLSSNTNTNYVIDWIKKTHTSSLGWIAEYDCTNPALSANAAKMQKAFGYRFVINDVSSPTVLSNGKTFDVSFNVTNVGNAPFYYNWPVEASLLNDDSTVAWSGTFTTDIRQWLPGQVFSVKGTFTVPSNLPKGTYTLALSVLDPAGKKPSLRFANTNYYKGGRTPIMKVGVGRAPSSTVLKTFDKLKTDTTLSYKLK